MTISFVPPGAYQAMSDITEKRVHDDDTGTTEVIVAAGIGVVSVSVSAGRIGRFGVAHRCSPRDVAAADGRLAVATAEDVLLRREGAFTPAGFGPAVAVGVHEGAVLAADGDGRIARHDHGADGRTDADALDADGWTDTDTLDTWVRAMDGPLLATDTGVYRVGGDDAAIRPAGLNAATDVAAAGPYVATDTGLYTLGNGWMRTMEDPIEAVAAASREHAYAVGEGLHRHHDGGWRVVDLPPDRSVADVAVDEHAYAITEGGTLLAGPDWRSRSLGVAEVAGIAVV
jgi:hypothetical protein